MFKRGKKKRRRKRVPYSEDEMVDLYAKHRLTRFDFYDAILNALMETNPKIKNHPAIKNLIKRVKACEQEENRGKLV